ncbi:MAG: hypothetical protein ABSF33_07325, partial [Acidimicrobiales bacterium]
MSAQGSTARRGRPAAKQPPSRRRTHHPSEGNTTMLDYVIRNGLVVDGTGAPARQADVGISNGRIAAVGQIDEKGAIELDAEGLVVAPGII